MRSNELNSSPRTTRRHGGRVVALTAAAIGGAALISASPVNTAMAATSSSSQAVNATVISGILTVTAPPTLVTNLAPGAKTSGIALGSLAYTDTLGAGVAPSVTVTSNDWSYLTNHIDFTNMTINPGATVTPVLGATGTLTPGAGGTLTGTDTTPGTTQSSPVTVATGTTSTAGSYTQTGSTADVVVPGGTPAGAYTGTIVYTITG
ncbi:MAG: hypothetical protein ABR564_04970 [Candidatus Dormibacteria bacterium]